MRRNALRRSRFGQSRSKFHAVPCADELFPELADRSFPSMLERAVAQSLIIRQRADHIKDLKFQHTIRLTRAGIAWRVDFSYIEPGVYGEDRIYHEAKGTESEGYLIKLKLYRIYGPGPLRIEKGSHRRHKIVETIIPEDWKNDGA